MAFWQVQDAKARFSEFLEASVEKGPQVVTRRGVETAVLISIEEWHRLQQAARPSLKDLLLASNLHFEDFQDVVAQRHTARRRAPVEFE